MTTVAITSASVGTKLATSTDAHITTLTVNTPTAGFDSTTPLVLVDAAAAPTGFIKSLFSAAMSALTFIFGSKPTMPYVTGITAPTSPWSLGANLGIPFANGVFVLSCPAGVTFNLTTGP